MMRFHRKCCKTREYDIRLIAITANNPIVSLVKQIVSSQAQSRPTAQPLLSKWFFAITPQPTTITPKPIEVPGKKNKLYNDKKDCNSQQFHNFVAHEATGFLITHYGQYIF